MPDRPAPTRFDQDTAVHPTGPGRFRAEIHEHWTVGGGANGGFIAALVARAMTRGLDAPGRGLRSLTTHYLSRPAFGPATIEVDVLRTGRSLSSVAATMRQDDRRICTALAAFSVPWDTDVTWTLPIPERAHEPGSDGGWDPPAFMDNFDRELRVDAPMFSGEGSSRTTGWIRTADPRPVDAIALVAIADAFPPALFPRVRDRMAVPTVDLTVHIRASLPFPGLGPDERVYAEFSTEHLADGFLEEDGAIWAPDGTLLAQSRQLAIAH